MMSCLICLASALAPGSSSRFSGPFPARGTEAYMAALEWDICGLPPVKEDGPDARARPAARGVSKLAPGENVDRERERRRRSRDNRFRSGSLIMGLLWNLQRPSGLDGLHNCEVDGHLLDNVCRGFLKLLKAPTRRRQQVCFCELVGNLAGHQALEEAFRQASCTGYGAEGLQRLFEHLHGRDDVPGVVTGQGLQARLIVEAPGGRKGDESLVGEACIGLVHALRPVTVGLAAQRPLPDVLPVWCGLDFPPAPGREIDSPDATMVAGHPRPQPLTPSPFLERSPGHRALHLQVRGPLHQGPDAATQLVAEYPACAGVLGVAGVGTLRAVLEVDG